MLTSGGFPCAEQKKRGNFRPDDWRSTSRGGESMDDIRDRYDSVTPTFCRALLDKAENRSHGSALSPRASHYATAHRAVVLSLLRGRRSEIHDDDEAMLNDDSQPRATTRLSSVLE
jgi:hypothetical protein